MSGALAMGNNKMTGLPWATQNGNAVDFEFFNSWTIPSQRIGNIFTYKCTTVIYNIRKIGDPREVITRDTCDKSFLRVDGYNRITADMNANNHKLTNLANPQRNKDVVNLQTSNKYIVKPSDHTNRFAYLMNPTTGSQLLQWTNLIGYGIELTKIDNLETTSANYLTYNKKVIYATVKKNSQGGYNGNWPSYVFP